MWIACAGTTIAQRPIEECKRLPGVHVSGDVLGTQMAHNGDTAASDGLGASLALEEDGAGSGSSCLDFLDSGPQVYCTSRTSSLGCLPSIDGPAATASLSAGAGSFDVRLDPVPGGLGNLGILIYTTRGPLANPLPVRYGYLCITQGQGSLRFLRLLAAPSGGTFGRCDGVYRWDLGNYLATQTQDPELVPGAVVQLQAWYRDPPNPAGANLSDAMAITLVP